MRKQRAAPSGERAPAPQVWCGEMCDPYTDTWAEYGVKLVAGKHVIIATPRPREVRVRESEARLYNLNPDGGSAGSASAASGAGRADRPGVTVEYAPGQRPDVFPRSPGHTPGTTYIGPVSSL